jgi:Flp pilus assembly protein protease CpaA
MTPATIAAVALGCAAIITDLWRGVIPNWLTGAGAAAGLGCGWWSGGAHGAAASTAGMVVGFLLFAPAFWLRGMGGGDVKLMAAFGALLGPSETVGAAALAAVAGALLALAAMWRRRRSIPYAPAIVCGAWLVLLGRG